MRRLLTGLALLCVGVSAHADSEDLIGGDGVIPINPDFNPQIGFDISDAAREALNIPQIQVEVDQTLGAALSSSLSASNRPSVLTPYGTYVGFENGEPVPDAYGSLLTNKANTLGRGKLGIGISYQRAKFDEFNGEDIGKQVDFSQKTKFSSVSNDIEIPRSEGSVFIVSRNELESEFELRARDVEFTADVVTLSLTYGLLENLDVGALLPYIWLNTQGEVEAKLKQSGIADQVAQRANGEVILKPDGTPIYQNVSAITDGNKRYRERFDRDYDGIGDMILYTKFQFLSQQGLPKRIKAPVDMALQVEVKLPTGDEDEFLGTGKTDVAARLLTQRRLTEQFRVRAEIGYNYSGLGSEFSTFDYKLGAEYQVVSSVSISGEVIGSYSREFEGIIDGVGGVKYEVTPNFQVFGGIRVPLNDNGLRYSFSPIIGAEYTIHPRKKADLSSIEPPAEEPVNAEPAPVESAPEATPPAEPAPGTTSAPEATKPAPAQPAAPTAAPGEPLKLLPPAQEHTSFTAPAAPAPSANPPAAPIEGKVAPKEDKLPMPGMANR